MHVAEYGAPVDFAEQAQLRSDLQGIIYRLRLYTSALKAKTESAGFLATIGSLVFPPLIGLSMVWSTWGPQVSGWESMFAIIDTKERSIEDVLSGATPLEKWANGVDVFRKEMESFAAYVAEATSIKASLAQLGSDIWATVKQYTKVTVTSLGIGAAIALGVLILVKR